MKNESKAMLSAQDLAGVQKVQKMAVADLMNQEQPLSNVVGIASGVKWSKGQPTGKPALLVLVSQKLEESEDTDGRILRIWSPRRSMEFPPMFWP
ncbi:MAG: hypothetical protein LUQ15_01070 [Methanothrix sp.]|nr:hypothetical protein [Methanothrix sp.]OYV09825.1 MAG: hypothetical protein CG437_665 [Methanosaeta sp. NSP1]